MMRRASWKSSVAVAWGTAVALGSVLRLVGFLHLDGEVAECLHLEDVGLLAHGQLGEDEGHRTVTSVHSTDLNGLETQVHQVVEHLRAGNAYGDATDDNEGFFFLRGREGVIRHLQAVE